MEKNTRVRAKANFRAKRRPPYECSHCGAAFTFDFELFGFFRGLEEAEQPWLRRVGKKPVREPDFHLHPEGPNQACIAAGAADAVDPEVRRAERAKAEMLAKGKRKREREARMKGRGGARAGGAKAGEKKGKGKKKKKKKKKKGGSGGESSGSESDRKKKKKKKKEKDKKKKKKKKKG